jgi:hypothetical protein
VPSPDVPLGAAAALAASGCQIVVQPFEVQMNLPADSPLSRYSVIPLASTRIVPAFGLDTTLTVAAEEPLEVVVGADEADDVEPPDEELLPQAASSRVAATAAADA